MTEDIDRLRYLRRRLREEILSEGELPEFLRPESIEVSEDARNRAGQLRDAALAGDRARALRIVRIAWTEEVLHRNVKEEDEKIPELDEAERRVENRISHGEEDGDAPVSGGGSEVDPR